MTGKVWKIEHFGSSAAQKSTQTSEISILEQQRNSFVSHALAVCCQFNNAFFCECSWIPIFKEQKTSDPGVEKTPRAEEVVAFQSQNMTAVGPQDAKVDSCCYPHMSEEGHPTVSSMALIPTTHCGTTIG